MAKIIEKIIEPSRIEVGSKFKIKIKIEDILLSKKSFITENGIKLVTENGVVIRSEWGDSNE